MFACDHSRRRSGRPAAAQIDTFAIEAHITTTNTAAKKYASQPLSTRRQRTAPKPLHEHFTSPSTTPSKVEKPRQQPPERLWETFIRVILGIEPPTLFVSS